MTDADLFTRVEYAAQQARLGRISVQGMALYLKQALNAYFGVRKVDPDPDDPTLASGPFALGEAPKGWEATEDFTAVDADLLEAGAEHEAPEEFDIDPD